MNTDIEIHYRHLSAEITDAFKLSHLEPDINIEIFDDKREYFDFSGGPAEILIYVNQHLTEIIVNGLLVQSLFEGLKYSIKTSWVKLVTYFKVKNSKPQEDKECIELNFKLHHDKAIEFNLKGDIDEILISNTVEKIFEYLKNETVRDRDFQTPELMDPHSLKPKIRLRFNQQTNNWEPINFIEQKRLYDEMVKLLSKNLPS